MKPGDIKQFEDIELSGRVVVSDPCYTRDVWCRGEIDVTPGVYETFLYYGDEGRVAKLQIVRKGAGEIIDIQDSGIDVGVDSGQAGIFCDTIYPHGNCTGEYREKGTFYGDICELTLGPGYRDNQRRYNWREQLKEVRSTLRELPTESSALRAALKVQVQCLKERLDNLGPELPDYHGGTYQGKGLVSSSGYGDGSYQCTVGKDKEGNTVFLEIEFISPNPVEDDDEDDCGACGGCCGG